MTAKIVEQTEKVEKVIRTASELPTGWKKACLVEIAEIIMGQSPSSEYYNVDRDGLPFFQGKAEFGDLYPEPVKWCSEPGKIAQKDDILISVRAPVGPTNLAPSECCIGRGLAAIRPREGIPSKYLLYYLRNIEASLDALGTGTTFKAISGKVLHAIPVPVAPPDEQNRIVAEIEKQFSRLDEAVANLNRVKANLKRYKAAVLKAAVEGKLTEDWREAHPDVEPASDLLKRILAERRAKWNGKGKYKEPSAPDTTELPVLPQGWIWSSVEAICSDVVDCPHSTPKWEESGRICLRTTEFRPGRLDLSDVRYVSNATYEKRIQRLKPRENDVVYSREGGILGVACMIPSGLEACLGQRMMLLRSHQLLIPNFLMYWLNSPRVLALVRSLTGGSASPHLNVGEVKLFAVPLPPVSEQYLIVEEVERRFSVISELETSVAANFQRTERFQQSILSQAFCGRLLPEDSVKRHLKQSVFHETQGSFG